jgi:uncharacterized protein YkwD
MTIFVTQYVTQQESLRQRKPFSLVVIGGILAMALLITACAPVRSGMPIEATVVTPPSSTPTEADEVERQVILLLNQERARHDLSALAENQQLAAAAEAHSQDMAQHDFFDHQGSDGSTVADRIERQDYRWRFFAENLACRYPTAEAVVQGWLASEGHRANILASEAQEIGVQSSVISFY